MTSDQYDGAEFSKSDQDAWKLWEKTAQRFGVRPLDPTLGWYDKPEFRGCGVSDSPVHALTQLPLYVQPDQAYERISRALQSLQVLRTLILHQTNFFLVGSSSSLLHR